MEKEDEDSQEIIEKKYIKNKCNFDVIYNEKGSPIFIKKELTQENLIKYFKKEEG